MAMILPDKIEEVIDEWPINWAGHSSGTKREFYQIASRLKSLWFIISELLDEEDQEQHFKALWILGYELSRDHLLSKALPLVSVEFRIKTMIEDNGPLLFGYYTGADESEFGKCCETFERGLRRAGLWEEYSRQGMVT
jgi:hypothetical protein